MITYRRPMKNLGIVKYDEEEKKERYMSFDDIFDLILSSFIVGILLGFMSAVLCFINV